MFVSGGSLCVISSEMPTAHQCDSGREPLGGFHGYSFIPVNLMLMWYRYLGFRTLGASYTTYAAHLEFTSPCIAALF